MLGEQIGSGQGKRTARRVIAVDPVFKVEVSFEDMGKLLGVEGMNIGTYTSSPRPDGTLEGEAIGVFATLDGQTVTWKAIGTGQLKAGGSVSYRGAITYSTISPKLARLNSIAGVFEFDSDADGNTNSRTWEWK